jgi:hypothetical protein
MWTLQPGFELGSWSKPVDVAANVPDGSFTSWQDEANGAHDAYWHAFGQNLKRYRADKGTTYLRIYHEYNGSDAPWSVKPGQEALFRQAWTRTATILRGEFPAVKMMLGAAAAGGDGRVKVADTWPTGVDVLSIDWYNEYPWCNTQACFDDKIENGGGANSLADLQRLAKAKGVPIELSEWGNAARNAGGGGGDAPVFFQAAYNWLRANAGTGPGQVLGECYFNIDGYDAQFQLYTGGHPNAAQPLSDAKYQQLWRVN